MSCLIYKIDPVDPDIKILELAASFFREGKLVVFPTETVYGLGANALDQEAVKRIFEAKGRPSNNPLITHIANINQVHQVISDWPEIAIKLATRYWPGPLTLIVHKAPNIPDLVTAGSKTIALRIPAHTVAQKLLALAQVPIAAPSANRSSEISPTQAEHVLKGLGNQVDLILDAGATTVGIESTVLDVTTFPPTLWRPGMISKVELESLIGPINLPNEGQKTYKIDVSPGQQKKHYAPKGKVYLVDFGAYKEINILIDRLLTEENNETFLIGCIVFDSDKLESSSPQLLIKSMPFDPILYAKKIYSVFHDFENSGVTHFIVENVPTKTSWDGVRDRLCRASAK